jgi:hypothetical protein
MEVIELWCKYRKTNCNIVLVIIAKEFLILRLTNRRIRNSLAIITKTIFYFT